MAWVSRITATAAAVVLAAAISAAGGSAGAAAWTAPPKLADRPVFVHAGSRLPSPYPPLGRGTHFLNDDALLGNLNDKAWYEANIPFLDIPDKQIQDVYYYRWRVWKEHLRYTDPQNGWILTEFLDCCGYAAPYQAINAAAGHHIDEGRWVRDQRYLDDYIRFWLTGPGQQPQSVDSYAKDWAHEYSFWAASAVYAQAAATGDWGFAGRLLPALEHQYAGWDSHYDAGLGLYWQVPVWDAKEFSPATYESTDTFAGVPTFRPSINAYQYGDALAISKIAAITGQQAAAREYAAKAAAIKAATQKWLWDPGRQFFYDVIRDGNPGGQRLGTREETGFVPWQFELPDAGDSAAWTQIMDPQGFYAPYGPTTVERRSPWFMAHAAEGCCHWDGPSWPYSTSQELTGLANLLDDYPSQSHVTRADYDTLLRGYALTQYRNGQPYVAEAHDPDQPNWIYDGYDHSEDYNHSSFSDLVISGLIGVRPQQGNALELKPLVPTAWNYFALENLPYHGHNITVLWDRDGSRYHAGPGLRVYVDGEAVVSTPALRDLTVPVGAVSAQRLPHLVNDAANPLRRGYPQPIASYTSPYDDPWHPLDGKVFYSEVPENTRWTNYASPNPQDFYGVDFGIPTPVDDVWYYGYDDGGGVRPAAGYTLQYWTGSGWADVPRQAHDPPQPVGNGLNRITFPALVTGKIRLVFQNPPGAFVGVNELQAWSPSSTAASLTAGPATGGQILVHSGTTSHITTTLTNASGQAETGVRVELTVPAGWTATPVTPATAAAIGPGASLTTTWSVTTPADALPGSAPPARVSAVYGFDGAQAATHARVPLQVAFDLSYYGRTQIDDRFTTDSSGSYTKLQPFPGEAIPTITAGGGTLSATANQRYFTLLDANVAPASGDAVEIVDPAQFVGNTPNEDTFFLALAKDNIDYVAGYYNNHTHIAGFDVRIAGALNQGISPPSTTVTIQPGDRFAFQLHGTTIASYLEHDGSWQQLASVDIGQWLNLSNPAVLAQYHFALGLRADFGTLAASRFEALAHG
jgi:hypothetical protein